MGENVKELSVRQSNGHITKENIGVNAENVDVTNSSSEIEPLTTTLENIDNKINTKAKEDHSDASNKYGEATNSEYGHVKIGKGLKIDTTGLEANFGAIKGLVCEGNDPRLDNKRVNPEKLHIGAQVYDGSEDLTISPASIGAAPKSHSSNETIYGVANSANYGHVKIDDEYIIGDGASDVAASTKAMHILYDSLTDGSISVGDAATLGGNLPSYYAKNEDLNNLSYSNLPRNYSFTDIVDMMILKDNSYRDCVIPFNTSGDESGLPSSHTMIGRIEKENDSNINVFLHIANSGEGKYKIAKVDGIWSNWVSDTGIESGSNENGRWVKFPDGTLECFGTVSAVFNSASALTVNWIYPETFTVIPIVMCQKRGVMSAGAQIKYRYAEVTKDPYLASSIIYAWSKEASFVEGDSLNIDVRAIGRWK